MRTFALDRCPSCHSTELLTFDVGEGHPLRRCSSCRLVFAPEYADPDEVFVDGYLLGGAGEFGIDVRGESFQGYLNKVGHLRMSVIEKASGLKAGSLLDVGCGTGEFLLAASQRGWATRGVEPEHTSAEVAIGRGLDVENALLEASGVPERSFDVVSAFHVLEHLPDSQAFLELITRWVKPGGFAVIEVPNFNCSQRRRWGNHWDLLRPLEHLVHFTSETLESTMVRAGLDPVTTRTPSYLGPPQNLDHALNDLARYGAFQRMINLFSSAYDPEEPGVLYPSRVGWKIIGLAELVHDRAGVGSVVFCVARSPGRQSRLKPDGP